MKSTSYWLWKIIFHGNKVVYILSEKLAHFTSCFVRFRTVIHHAHFFCHSIPSFAWAKILPNSTAEEIAFQLYDLCLGLGLVPNAIQSDNGRQFVGQVVRYVRLYFFGARGGEVLVTLNDWISIAKPDSINVYIVGKGNTI